MKMSQVEKQTRSENDATRIVDEVLAYAVTVPDSPNFDHVLSRHDDLESAIVAADASGLWGAGVAPIDPDRDEEVRAGERVSHGAFREFTDRERDLYCQIGDTLD